MPRRIRTDSIAALGIGRARERADVLCNVRAFMPDAAITCLESEQAGEGPGIAPCGATLGDGYIRLLFDPANHLIEARVDVFEFT